MHAMILDEKLNFKWAQVPDPVRKSNEVLIQVSAAAVNRADLMQKDGNYASPAGWPAWCGLEVAGTVLEAPADAEVKPGDKVCALLGGGGSAVDYGAEKAGMNGLTKSLAILGAPHGVRSCCVIPGPVLTRPDMAKMKTILGRAAEPIELVNFVLYLCSDKAAFITGSSHLIDGGRMLVRG